MPVAGGLLVIGGLFTYVLVERSNLFLTIFDQVSALGYVLAAITTLAAIYALVKSKRAVGRIRVGARVVLLITTLVYLAAIFSHTSPGRLVILRQYCSVKNMAAAIRHNGAENVQQVSSIYQHYIKLTRLAFEEAGIRGSPWYVLLGESEDPANIPHSVGLQFIGTNKFKWTDSNHMRLFEEPVLESFRSNFGRGGTNTAPTGLTITPIDREVHPPFQLITFRVTYTAYNGPHYTTGPVLSIQGQIDLFVPEAENPSLSIKFSFPTTFPDKLPQSRLHYTVSQSGPWFNKILQWPEKVAAIRVRCQAD